MSQSITQHMKLKLKFFPNPQAPNLIWQQMTKVQILIFFDNEHSIHISRLFSFHIKLSKRQSKHKYFHFLHGPKSCRNNPFFIYASTDCTDVV